MDKSIVNRTIKWVTLAICHLSQQYIKLPETEDQKRNIQLEFFGIVAFSKVIAAVDCTHIKIQSPSIGSDDAETFCNRKNFYSLNVQAAVDDNTISNNSILKASFERNDFPNCFLLGDSGYAIKKYLLTPTGNQNQS